MYDDPEGKFLGFLLQLAVSALAYIVIAVTAIFNEEVRENMDAINWNPFNSDEELVLESTKVSFYKGVPVFRTNGDRSGSFCAIFLTKETNNRQYPSDVLRHEWGHNVQQMILGPVKFAIFIGLPSWQKFGKWDDNGRYYDAPWEVTADMFGGVENAKHFASDKFVGIGYFVIDFLI